MIYSLQKRRIRSLFEYEGSIVVFDDMLEYNQNAIEPFYYKRRPKDLDFRCSLFRTTLLWFNKKNKKKYHYHKYFI